MTGKPLLFHQTAEQLRRVSARGGRASARNRRARLRTTAPPLPQRCPRRSRTPTPPPPLSPPWKPSFRGAVRCSDTLPRSHWEMEEGVVRGSTSTGNVFFFGGCGAGGSLRRLHHPHGSRRRGQ
jgi:hypothetical protein